MIQQVEITGVHFEVDDDLKKYVGKKVGRLDLFMSAHARKSARAEVKLKEEKIKTKRQLTCEVILHLPHETLTVKETTINMYAAIDVVEAKLRNQLKKYKEMHSKERFHQRILARIKHRPGK